MILMIKTFLYLLRCEGGNEEAGDGIERKKTVADNKSKRRRKEEKHTSFMHSLVLRENIFPYVSMKFIFFHLFTYECVYVHPILC